MSRPRFCRRCKRGDKGDGMFRKNDRWDDTYLTDTVANIKKYGKIEMVDACEKCIRDIESREHFVRRKK